MRRALEEVVIHLAALGEETHELFRVVPHIEVRAIAVVVEDAVSASALPADIERDALIQRVRSFLVAGRVGVPHGELPAPPVQPCGLFAQPVEVLVEPQLFRGGNGPGLLVVQHGALVAVDELVGGGIAKVDQKRRAMDHHFELAGGDEQAVRPLRERPARHVPGGPDDGRRGGPVGQSFGECRAHANQVGRQNPDAHLRPVHARDGYGVVGRLPTGVPPQYL